MVQEVQVEPWKWSGRTGRGCKRCRLREMEKEWTGGRGRKVLVVQVQKGSSAGGGSFDERAYEMAVHNPQAGERAGGGGSRPGTPTSAEKMPPSG